MHRLTKEIRLLKESQAAPPTFTGGFKDNTSGDYAMLAGKPIMGYRLVQKKEAGYCILTPGDDGARVAMLCAATVVELSGCKVWA